MFVSLFSKPRWRRMTSAFVGFVVVALVGGAAEMARRFRCAQDRLDLSVGIALGSAAQIALFVAPVLALSVMSSARRR